MSNLSDNPNLIVEKFYADDFKEKPDNYDNRHTQRLRQTLEHLKSYNIKNQVVCDMGCGSGWFLKNLDQSNRLIGFDGAFIDKDGIERYKHNLDYENFADISGVKDVDHMLCFETFEHLTNPYNFIFECKKMMKNGALFHISYPSLDIQHNTFYPSLLWDTGNFTQFMEQMAFSNKKEFKMSTRYGHVHFFVFENMPWSEVKMKWPKKGEKFKGQPPHVQVNL
jgi:2-polyprenyl-3-methyl-5-hydroxy-6-metoxy-1,4-benzoquinol methylase